MPRWLFGGVKNSSPGFNAMSPFENLPFGSLLNQGRKDLNSGTDLADGG